MEALAITLPFQMLPVADGDTQPENIDVSDISFLCVRFAGVGETGIGKPIETSGATRYELSGSAITVHVAPIAEKGEAAIIIDGKYGQVNLHAKIVLNVGSGIETITTVSPYVFMAIATDTDTYELREKVDKLEKNIVTISQNTQTGGYDIAIGDESAINIAGNSIQSVSVKYNSWITSNLTYLVGQSNLCIVIPVEGGDKITGTVSEHYSYVALLKSLSNINTDGGIPDFSSVISNRISFSDQSDLSITVPSDARYLWVGFMNYNSNFRPNTLYINGIDFMSSISNAFVSIGQGIKDANKNVSILRNDVYGKVTNLVGFGQDGSFYNPNWKVGDIMYNTSSHLLRKCESVSQYGAAISFITEPFDLNIFYYNKQDSKYYVFNGSVLVESSETPNPSLREEILEETENLIDIQVPPAVNGIFGDDFLNRLKSYPVWVLGTSKYKVASNQMSLALPVKSGDEINVTGNGVANSCYFSVLKSLDGIDTDGSTPDFSDMYTERIATGYNGSTTIYVPDDAHYILIGMTNDGSTSYRAGSIKLNSVELKQALVNYLLSLTTNDSIPSFPFYVAEQSPDKIVNYQTLLNKYDALVSEFSSILTKNELGSTALGTKIYEYVLDTGNYNSAGNHQKDPSIVKPKIILITGVHGNENGSITSTLNFFANMVNNVAMLSKLKNGLQIRLIPCVNPDGLNAGTRYNSQHVDINRNFNINWVAGGNEGDGYYGARAADQNETQIIQDWLAENNDAAFFLDYHNDWTSSELSYIYSYDSTNEECLKYKRAYLLAINKMINYWITQGIPYTTIFGYCAKLDTVGTAINYGQNSIGLSSFLMEIPISFPNDDVSVGKATVKGGAEILGNVLVEFYDKLLSLI